ncbi:hypothetical protein ANCCAN_25107 [Ancylostoma caninum]|uniref:Tyrosinase copper-binding domain-containing protein n=1 Tax=Ancylostoma caninum TaxID=29170 RepID=A0A368FC09_ANCCA|nr:hypothetical protein ANCCAN_25107 [Ancylostoma caninum]
MEDHEVALPYWDPTLDYELSNPTHSVLWSEELMGEQGWDGYVHKSPFKSWKNGSGIKRNLGAKGYLMKETDITTITDWTNEYQHIFAHTAASPGCPNPGYWSAIEYIGADPQLFVGGDMQNFLTASNDPLFWSLHAMVDLIWEEWRNLYQWEKNVHIERSLGNDDEDKTLSDSRRRALVCCRSVPGGKQSNSPQWAEYKESSSTCGDIVTTSR